MKIKVSILLLYISVLLVLVGCSTESKLDITEGQSLLEIDNEEIEVTIIDSGNSNASDRNFEKWIQQLKDHSNVDMEIENINNNSNNSVVMRYEHIEDYGYVIEKEMFNNTLNDYLDKNNLSYDEFEDRDLLYHVHMGDKITESEIKKYKKYRLVKVYCGNAKVKVDGEILFASKHGKIVSKNTLNFKDYNDYYILYKKSSGIKKWVLWALLLLVISYAIYLSIRWQYNRKEEKICLCCGQKNDDDAIYCKICGIKIITEKEKNN
ncbi:MAG: hypothetical protein N4A50_12135 [Vallitalea sp.]|jgi:hypothetical protein|nr:hypothetical protein [Vallitalea sp.]